MAPVLIMVSLQFLDFNGALRAQNQDCAAAVKGGA